MAQPSTDFPDFASDTNYATGPDVGTPTKVAPSAGEISSGFIRQTAAVPQYMNYLLSTARQWFNYLKTLQSDAQFLGFNFSWTGTHTHAAVTTHNAGVALNSGATLGPAMELGYSAARTRILTLSWTAGSGYVDGAGGVAGPHPSVANGVRLVNGAGALQSSWTRPLQLPQNAIITGWRAIVLPDASGTAVNVELYKREVDFGLTGETPTLLSSDSTTGSLKELLAPTSISETVVAGCEYYFYAYHAVSGGSKDATLLGLEITYTEQRASGSN